jgi:hypothetical protein
MEKKIKHLEMIQNIITRMANNSFLLKGWCIVLISALFALASKEMNKYFLLLPFLPLISFWILDGYFLWQERLYRKLYTKVKNLDESSVDFDMNAYIFRSTTKGWISTIFSLTLNIFYLPILVSITVVIIISFL